PLSLTTFPTRRSSDLFEKGKQSLAVNIERGGQIPHFFVGVVQVRLCQGEQLLLQGNRFPKELTPIDRLRIPPPIPQVAAKPIPKTKQPGHHGQRVPAKLLRRTTPRDRKSVV